MKEEKPNLEKRLHILKDWYFIVSLSAKNEKDKTRIKKEYNILDTELIIKRD